MRLLVVLLILVPIVAYGSAIIPPPPVGGGVPSIGGGMTGGTAGSVLFVNPTNTISQNNNDFFWDDTNKRLGLKTTASPSYTLDVNGTFNLTGLATVVGITSTGTVTTSGKRITTAVTDSTTTATTIPDPTSEVIIMTNSAFTAFKKIGTTAPTAGQRVTIVNMNSGGNIINVNDDTFCAGSNCIDLPSDLDEAIPYKSFMNFFYDGTSSRWRAQPLPTGIAGSIPLFDSNGVMSSYVPGANALVGGNAANSAIESKVLSGTTSQIVVTHGTGTITLSTPQNIATGSSPTFAGLTLSSPLTIGNGGTGAASLGAGVVKSDGSVLSTEAQLAIARGGTGQGTKSAGFDALSPMSASGDIIYGGTSGTGTALAKGSNGNVLTLASGLPSWASSNGITSAASELSNIAIAASSGSSNLTVSLTDAGGSAHSATSVGKISFRSTTASTGTYTQRAITASLTGTSLVTSGTTLGLVASTTTSLYVYVVDSDGSGTLKMGVSTALLDDSTLQSTVPDATTVTISNASPAVFTATGHGFNNGDAITLTTGGTLPTGLTTGTTYFVVSTAANTFSVSATVGGTAINTSGAGSGTHTARVAGPRLVSTGVYASKAVRLVGRISGSLSTPGTWTSFPSEIDNLTQPITRDPVMVRYTRSSTFSTSNSFAIFDYSTKDYDTCNCVTTGASWKFVAPRTDYYRVTMSNAWGASGTRTGDAWNYIVTLYKNGVAGPNLAGQKTDTGQTAANAQTLALGSATIFLNYGEYIQVEVYEEQGYTTTVADATKNWVSIETLR